MSADHVTQTHDPISVAVRRQRSVSERYHQGVDPVSTTIKKHSLSMRHHSVGWLAAA